MSPRQPLVYQWLPGRSPSDVTIALQRLQRAEDVQHIAVMPDVHLSNDICVGTVVATTHLLYPGAVGGDIGCGMIAAAFDCSASALRTKTVAGHVLAGLYRMIPSVRHHQRPLLPEHLQQVPSNSPHLENVRQRDGVIQFATLGRGNHFVELQYDDEDRLWLMIHSGSRAIGQAIHRFHFQKAQLNSVGLRFLDADSPEGKAYLSDLQWASSYAHASRRAMAEATASILHDELGTSLLPDSIIHCNHNHVRQETHSGRQLWVHRKGAISALPDEEGIIPGSMGTESFHVQGRGNPDSLCSSSHGAGRTMSRSQACRSISANDLQKQLKDVWYDRRLADQLRDEAPKAYKDINVVMRAQSHLTRIVRRLRPILSYKGI